MPSTLVGAVFANEDDVHVCVRERGGMRGEAMAAPSDAELIAALEGMITPESVDALSMKKVMKQL